MPSMVLLLKIQVVEGELIVPEGRALSFLPIKFYNFDCENFTYSHRVHKLFNWFNCKFSFHCDKLLKESTMHMYVLLSVTFVILD